MLYFKTLERVMAGPNILHYYDFNDAINFALDMIVKNNVYNTIYQDKFREDPEHVYKKVKDDTEELMEFVNKCFQVYGFRNIGWKVVEEEPFHTYTFDKQKLMWVMNDFNQGCQCNNKKDELLIEYRSSLEHELHCASDEVEEEYSNRGERNPYTEGDIRFIKNKINEINEALNN